MDFFKYKVGLFVAFLCFIFSHTCNGWSRFDTFRRADTTVPKVKDVMEGDNIKLTCNLTRSYCHFFHNGNEVQIQKPDYTSPSMYHRHSYQRLFSLYYKPCEMEIRGFTSTDAGYWHCTALFEESEKLHLKIIPRSTTILPSLKIIPRRQAFTAQADENTVIAVNPSNATVVENDSVNLDCMFREDSRDCAWFHNGTYVYIGRYSSSGFQYLHPGADIYLTKNCSIKIRQFTRSDAGFWQCAKNKQQYTLGQASKKAFLTLKSDFSDIAVHPSNATVLERDDVILQCMLREDSKECAWFHNGSYEYISRHSFSTIYQYLHPDADLRFTKNCSIKIRQFTKSDAGFWQCAKNKQQYSLGQASNKAFLTLKSEDTVITVHPSNASVSVHEDITLQCMFNKDSKDCVWFHNGTSVSISNDFIRKYHYLHPDASLRFTKNCSINIRQFTTTDAGYWQCAKNKQQYSLGQASNKAFLTLESDNAVIVVHPSNATISENDTVILYCMIKENSTECAWFHNGSYVNISRYSLSGYQYLHPESCSMKIRQFTRIDAGFWQCAKNKQQYSLGQASKKAFLTWNSDIAVHPSNATVLEHDAVTLQCMLSENSKDCDWFHNGSYVIIPRNSLSDYQYLHPDAELRLTKNCSIIIRDFAKSDAGFWQCAKNKQQYSLGQASNKAFLTLKSEDTVITVHPSNASVSIHEDITLQCMFNKDSKDCAWFHNGTSVSISKGFIRKYHYLHPDANLRFTKNCSIKIRQFTTTDAGYWQCAKNKQQYFLGQASNNAFLTLESDYKIAVHPADATVSEQDDVILQCMFSEESSDCAWFHNGHYENIRYSFSDKYHYLNPEDTKNCAIKIHDFRKSDTGYWQCAKTKKHYSAGKASNKAFLTWRPGPLDSVNHASATSGFQHLVIILSIVGFVIAGVIIGSIIFLYKRNQAKKKYYGISSLLLTHGISKRKIIL